jgi:asparagine synthase (glutamine-hydrolysing)
MCGILAIFSSSLDPTTLRKVLISSSSELRHRGPDWSGYIVIDKNDTNNPTNIPLSHGIAHERLAIMDPESGSQPLVSADGNIIVAANGEVYNYKEIYDSKLVQPYVPMTGSDCEVILPLWTQYTTNSNNNTNSDLSCLPNVLRGMFSIIIYDKTSDTYFIFRDHVGKTPLYIGWGDDGSTWVSSEMKGLIGKCNKFQNFPPGHYYSNKGRRANEFVRWYCPSWAPEMIPGLNVPVPQGQFQAVSIFIYIYVVMLCYDVG